jgi:hypothetical protein
MFAKLKVLKCVKNLRGRGRQASPGRIGRVESAFRSNTFECAGRR